MTRVLRYENGRWPLIRILYADTFGATGAGPWTEADYWDATIPNGSQSSIGLYLEECSRQSLPGIGEATISMDYGTIDGIAVTPLDLQDKHIRIQAADKPDDERATPAWRTIWVGRCVWQTDDIDAASDIQRGTRTYRCNDLLYAYLSNYPMDRHVNYLVTGNLSCGHPGYNYDKDSPGGTIGNKDSTNAGYGGPDSTTIVAFGIDDPSNGKTRAPWTEAQALNNILLLQRSAGDPIFDIDDPLAFLGEASPIPINDTEKAWTAVLRILDRRRGKGMAFLDWDDDSANPTGALDVKLRVRPQLYADISYTYAGTTYTVKGASDNADYFTSVDLQGDHRIAGPVSIRSTSDSAVDELTTEGERIQVAVTVSGDDDTHAYRWTSQLEAAWTAADDDERAQEVYKPVLQYYGLKREAGVSYKNGDGSGAQRGDWWTTPLGVLTLPSGTVTAPDMIEVMDDLPLYEGYDYALSTPAPASSGSADGKPRRRKPLLLVRAASGRFLLPEDYLGGGCQVSVDDDGYWAEWSGSPGERNCRDGDAIDESSMTFTLGLKMPQRVRFAVSVAGTVRRRLTLRIPDCHLWIGHAGAIWDVDGSDVNYDGAAPKRIGGTIITADGTVAGKLLRDDRAKLARIHYLAWEWYRSDSTRRAASWEIRACGMLPSWKDVSGTDILNPKLGQVITTMAAGGELYNLYTPVSRIAYDNRRCSTMVETDWMEFDHGAA